MIKVFIGSFVTIEYALLHKEVQPCPCGEGDPTSNYCPNCGAKKDEEVATEFDGLDLYTIKGNTFIYSCSDWLRRMPHNLETLPPSRYLSGADLDKAIPLMLLGGVIQNNSILIVME